MSLNLRFLKLNIIPKLPAKKLLLNRLQNRKNYSSSTSTWNEAYKSLKGKGLGNVHLKLDQTTSIATITLDQLKKKNAISGSMMIQLEEAISELEKWKEGKGVILKAEGDFFCSGGDISEATMTNTSEYGLLMSSFMHHTLTRLYCLPMVTVTLVHGKAIGGGAELITATDFRLFSPSGEVTFVQGKMGVVPGWGGGTRLVKMLNAKTALNILTTCEKLTPEKALEIGFAEAMLPSNNLEFAANEWLQSRIQHDYTVVRAMKKIIVGARDLNLEQSLENERLTFAPLWGGDANRKALDKKIKHK